MKSQGIGFAGVLTLIFVVAKLFGVIDWSWWLVFLPLYIGFLIVSGVFVVGIIVAIVCTVIEAVSTKRRAAKRRKM